MTGSAKANLLTAKQLADLGINIVIYPVDDVCGWR